MAISIKGVNTGVIRQKNEFVALALKIKEPRNKESLFFLSPLGLRDLLIALESRLYMKHQLSEDARLQYEKERDKASKKMHENIPLIQEDELKNADINRRINSLTLVDDKGENLSFSLTLHDGKTDELLVNELQIQVLAHAIIHAGFSATNYIAAGFPAAVRCGLPAKRQSGIRLLYTTRMET